MLNFNSKIIPQICKGALLIRNRFNNVCILLRFYNIDSVRVRFAPSPTGYLHLGGLRTALYNFLFAKSQKGKFILRIEDTDQSRLVEGANEQMTEDLTWMGIQIHEGPHINAEFGPYIQSKRLHIYQEQVDKLLKNGSAYKCFCTERRLNLLRREAQKNRQVPKYDNKCRHLNEKEIAEKLDQGKQPCVRFKLSSDITFYEDLIYGKVSYDVAQNEGDPIIMKSDGFPTYHFANVVDDHFMKISHVLRGVEWQISTTKHLLLYRAFGWNPPNFGHLPLLLNSDGTKLSKRQNDIKINHYRDTTVFPLALINYVVNAGGGFAKDSQQNVKPRIYSIDELTEQFELKKLNTNSGKLMPERLLEFNQLELKRLLKNSKTEEELVNGVQVILLDHFKNSLNPTCLQIDKNHIRSVLHWSSDRINKLNDLISNNMSFIWTIPKTHHLPNEEHTFIRELIEQLELQNPFSRKHLNDFLKSFAEQRKLKYNIMMKTLRSTLCGLQEGPSVAEIMNILGKEATLQRLKIAINIEVVN